MPLHELKQVQLQDHFTLMTHDSISHLKTLCMSIFLLSGSAEFEWKCCSSLLSIEKPLGTTSKPNRRLTSSSVRFRAVSVVLNNDNRPEPTGDQRLGFEASP